MITVTFVCGHKKQANGSEDQLVCSCGEQKIANVDAPAPQFRGHVRGPHAEFTELPAKAVSFGETNA